MNDWYTPLVGLDSAMILSLCVVLRSDPSRRSMYLAAERTFRRKPAGRLIYRWTR